MDEKLRETIPIPSSLQQRLQELSNVAAEAQVRKNELLSVFLLGAGTEGLYVPSQNGTELVLVEPQKPELLSDAKPDLDGEQGDNS